MARTSGLSNLALAEWLHSKGWREGKDGRWRTDRWGGAFNLRNAVTKQERQDHTTPSSNHWGGYVHSGYRTPEHSDRLRGGAVEMPRVMVKDDFPRDSKIIRTEMRVSNEALISTPQLNELMRHIGERIAHDLVDAIRELKEKSALSADESKILRNRLTDRKATFKEEEPFKAEYLSTTPALDKLDRDVKAVCNHA